MRPTKKRAPSLSSMGTNESTASRTSSIAVKKTYNIIKLGVRKANPAAIILWAFHKIPSKDGLTSRRVINFLKKHYRAISNPEKTGKSIGAILRCAVEFGLLIKRRNKYYLAAKQ